MLVTNQHPNSIDVNKHGYHLLLTWMDNPKADFELWQGQLLEVIANNVTTPSSSPFQRQIRKGP